MTLEEKLVALRKGKNLSQLELSEILHISRQAISRWEVGIAVPTTDNLRVLSELYGVSIDYLLSDAAEMSDTIYTDDNSSEKTANKRKKYVRMLLSFILVIAGIAIAYQNKNNNETLITEMETEEEPVNFSGDFSVSW